MKLRKDPPPPGQSIIQRISCRTEAARVICRSEENNKFHKLHSNVDKENIPRWEIIFHRHIIQGDDVDGLKTHLNNIIFHGLKSTPAERRVCKETIAEVRGINSEKVT